MVLMKALKEWNDTINSYYFYNCLFLFEDVPLFIKEFFWIFFIDEVHLQHHLLVFTFIYIFEFVIWIWNSIEFIYLIFRLFLNFVEEKLRDVE